MSVDNVINRDKVENPLISIVIPIFNTEEYLEESLDSVVNQTLTDLEIICINDNSTDDSLKLLKEYAKKDKRIIIIINNERLGPSVCRNIGLENVSGEYIVFHDSDDFIELDAYEKLYNFSNKFNPDFVVFDALRFNDECVIWESILHDISISGEIFPKTNILECNELIYDTTSWNKFIKKNFFDKYNFKFSEGRVYQDILFSIQLFCASDCVGVYPEVKYYWRVRDDSITQKVNNIKNLQDRIFITKEVINVLKSSKHEILLENLYKKLVEIDILQFINELDNCDDEYKKIMYEIVKPFVKKLPHDFFKNLNYIDKVKYDLFLNGNFESLNSLLVELNIQKTIISMMKEEYEYNKTYITKLKNSNLNAMSKNNNLKEEIRIIKSTKGWFKYKIINIYRRIFNKID